MYKALYRQERPERFKDVLGQEHIIKVLENQIKTNKVGHAYLFCGTRGTGKTTIARLLAKGVNCLSENSGERPCGGCAHCQAISEGTFVDVIEMDAASNRGIMDVREIRESIKYPPSVGRKKVYIIDEVHMLTTPAFNALLKTLEEPPENIIFILATTDPEQLPQTILSRCQRMDFRRLGHKNLAEYYQEICKNRGVELKPEAADILATNADGSVRDGLSLLEQSLASGEKVITEDVVNLYGGAISQEFLTKLTDCVLQGDVAGGIKLINSQIESGKESGQILKDWIRHFRNLMVAKVVDEPEDVINLSAESVNKIVESCKTMELDRICEGLRILAETEKESKGSAQPRVFLDLSLMKLCALFNSQQGGNFERPIKVARQPEPKLKLESLIGDRPETPAETQARKREQTGAETNSIEKNEKAITAENAEGKDKLTVSKASVKEESENSENFDEVWTSICEMVIRERPSIGTLRKKAEISAISQNTIKIEAGNEITAKRLEDGLQIISEAATVILGRPIRAQVTLQGEAPKSTDDEDDETIQKLKELLGDIPIRMQ